LGITARIRHKSTLSWLKMQIPSNTHRSGGITLSGLGVDWRISGWMTFFGQGNVEYRDILPKTMVGKVLRRDLASNETERSAR
jgi:hypothetical protein